MVDEDEPEERERQHHEGEQWQKAGIYHCRAGVWI
jgi:hypothetical protein